MSVDKCSNLLTNIVDFLFRPGTARPPSEKRHQPLPAEGEPHKIARISQSNPRSETLSIHPATSSHASWYRAPILIQQRSNPEPGEVAHLPIKTPAQPMEAPRYSFVIFSLGLLYHLYSIEVGKWTALKGRKIFVQISSIVQVDEYVLR